VGEGQHSGVRVAFVVDGLETELAELIGDLSGLFRRFRLHHELAGPQAITFIPALLQNSFVWSNHAGFCLAIEKLCVRHGPQLAARYCTCVVIGLLLSTINIANPRTVVFPGLIASWTSPSTIENVSPVW